MKLINNFYKVISKDITESSASYTIELNAAHTIYKAHFPDRAVTPGACIVEMANELLEDYLSLNLQIIKLVNVKYLNIIEPGKSPIIKYAISNVVKDSDNNTVKAQFNVLDGEIVLSKLSIIARTK